MKKLIVVLLTIAILVFAVGCQKADTKDSTRTAITSPATTVIEGEDASVSDIESDISEIDNLEDDINLDELDQLDADLASI